MIGTLVMVAFVAFILGGITSSRSGKTWAYLTTISFATVALSLLVSSVLLFFRPPYAPLPDDLGTYRGRGAMLIVAVWEFFHTLGPKGTGLLLGGFGVWIARAVHNQIQALKAGTYIGTDELEKTAAAHNEFLALPEKIKSLADSNKADSRWIQAQPKTYPNRAEAEKVAAEINAANARIRARNEEIDRLARRATELRVVLGMPSRKEAHSPPETEPASA